jgi:fatty-acyl-CoA synthase
MKVPKKVPGSQINTLTDSLARAATVQNTGLRFLDRRERPTWLEWAEVYERALIVAGGLKARDLRRGAAVGLLYPTGEEFFSAFFGTLLAGAVPVPLYPPVRLGRIGGYQDRTARMLLAARIELALVDRRVRDLVAVALEKASCQGLTLSELPKNGPVCEKIDGEDLALVQFSSGTTVEPKPVALSHRAVLAQIQALNDFWPDGDTHHHTGASWLPLYHDMGLIGCVLPVLERPSELTLIPPEVFVARPAHWLRAISQYEATVSPAPNFAYGLCLERIRDEELAGVDLSSWRVALNGAESIAPAVARAFCKRFARWGFRPEAMTPVYGLSEAALAVTFSPIAEPFETKKVAREPLSKKGEAILDEDGMELISVGKPMPGFAVEIRNPEGDRLPEARVGSIWVKGPSLMKGYLYQPEATSEVMPNGRLDTGDLGFMLEGKLFVTGRAKDVLIVRGQNHAPEEIESVVNALPGVRAGCCAVVGYLPEGEAEERVVLFVERESKTNGTGSAGIAAMSAKEVLALTGISLDRVEVLKPGAIPRTSSGKIRRAETLHRFLSGDLRTSNPFTPRRMIRADGGSAKASYRLKLDS